MSVPQQDSQETNMRTKRVTSPFFRPQKNNVLPSNAVRLGTPIVAVPDTAASAQCSRVADGTWPETWYGAMLLPQSTYLLNDVLIWLSHWTRRTKQR
jgi:hypothetical protein